MRQVSPESEGILDYLIELHKSCQGDWDKFVRYGLLDEDDLNGLLTYAATFLSNVGNYYASLHRCECVTLSN